MSSDAQHDRVTASAGACEWSLCTVVAYHQVGKDCCLVGLALLGGFLFFTVALS